MKTLEPGLMVTSNVRLERPLGAGGMGRVWVAEHLGLKTRVVVKFMTEELTKSGEGRVRFEREAAAAARVRSPHVVQTFDHGVMDDGVPYIVMELLEGHDLDELLAREGAQSLTFVRDMVQQLCRALEKAHQVGIIHRDVKPSNVFLCDAGSGELFVKLLDFGIAKGATGNTLSEQTQTGLLMGSPLYMSPEQIVGSKSVDHRSDLWAVGVLTYQALTGVRPFQAETMGGLALQIANEPLPMPSSQAPHLPSDVDIWFAKACAREPSERFSSAKELAEAFAFALSGELSSQVMVPKMADARVAGQRSSSPTAVSHTLSTSDTVAMDTVTIKRKRLFFLGGAAVLAIGILGGIASRVYSTDSPKDGSQTSAAAAKETAPHLPPLPDSLALPSQLPRDTPAPSASTAASGVPSVPSPSANTRLVRPPAAAVPSVAASGTAQKPVAPPAKTNAVDPIL